MNKFNINEKVYYIHDNIIQEGPILCIRCKDYSNPTKGLIYEVPVKGISSVGKYEENIFKTKGELVENLLK